MVRAISGDGEWWYPAGSARRFVEHWVQFDSHWYLDIAANGYSYQPGSQSSIAWFPVYPLLIRAFASLGGEAAIWAAVVTTFGGVALAVLLTRWLRLVSVLPRAVPVAWAVVMVSPFAWYLYGVPYADSVFLAFVAGSFILLETDRPRAAGLVIALATATRPTGFALLIGGVVLHLERVGVLVWSERRVDWRRASWRDAAPALGVLGVGSYSLYLGLRFGAPLAFLTNQREFRDDQLVLAMAPGVSRMLARWREVPTGWLLLAVLAVFGGAAFLVRFRRRWPTSLLLGTGAGVLGVVIAASRWRDMVAAPVLWGAAGTQALLVLAVAGSIPAVLRRLGLGYAVYTLLLVVMCAATTSNFIGCGRYLLAAFPTALVWGELIARSPRWRIAVPVLSAVVMGALSFGFTRGWYLS